MQTINELIHYCFIVLNRQATVHPVSKFGKGINDIWMDNLACIGNELDISNCSFRGWGKSNCTHFMDVGIACGM